MSIAGKRVAGGGHGLTHSKALGDTVDNHPGTTAGHEIHKGGLDTVNGRYSLFNGLDAMPARQPFNSKLDCAATGYHCRCRRSSG